jgi:exodeoxyribonuclease VII small subunit
MTSPGRKRRGSAGEVKDLAPETSAGTTAATEPAESAGAAKTAAGADNVEFAKALKTLEGTVKSLESGELSLEDSLKKFEEGIKLARQLESILDRAERKVEEILNPAGPEEQPKGEV